MPQGGHPPHHSITSSAVMSALPPRADTLRGSRFVHFVPIADIRTYSITSSTSLPRSGAGDVDNGLGKSLGVFLGQVVPDAAGDVPMLVLTDKLLRIGLGVRVRRAIRITL